VDDCVREGGVMVMVARSAPRRAASSLCACTNCAVFQRLPITFQGKSEESVSVVALRPRAEVSSCDVGSLWLLWNSAAAPSGDSSFVERLWRRRAMVAAKRQIGEMHGEDGALCQKVARVVARRKNVSLPCSALLASASSCLSGLRSRKVKDVRRRFTGPDARFACSGARSTAQGSEDAAGGSEAAMGVIGSSDWVTAMGVRNQKSGLLQATVLSTAVFTTVDRLVNSHYLCRIGPRYMSGDSRSVEFE